MKLPQIENGYTIIANALLEQLCAIRIPGEAMQIFFVIMRKTYGFHRKEAQISLKQFCKETGIKKPNILRGLRKLQKIGVITVIQKDNDFGVTYSIQKDYTLWRPLSKKITNVIQKDNDPLSKKITNVIQKDNDFGVNGLDQKGYEPKKTDRNSLKEKMPLSKKITNVIQKDNDPLSKKITPINNKEILLKKNINKGAHTKEKFLSFVYLKPEEYQKLCEMFGEVETHKKIQKLDDYIAMKGVKYKDHYRTILVWNCKAEEKKIQEVENEKLRKMREAF